MTKKEFNKLVRDRIPEIITANGDVPHTSVMGIEEYKRALLDKSVEETKELCAAGTKEEITEEIADVLEVLEAVAAAYNIPKDEIETAKNKKLEKRGGFSGRILLEYTEGE